jgi:hypothetical protein
VDGFKENYHVIQKFLEYSHNQHLAKKLWKPEEVSVWCSALAVLMLTVPLADLCEWVE